MGVSGDDRARLEARNAAARDQVDRLLAQFHRHTEQLREAQAAAAASSATVTSRDGLVRVTVDATGSLTGLKFAPSTFDRGNPDELARTVLEAAREGVMRVRRQVADLMTPLTEGVPDLADVVEGAPSLRDLMPRLPGFSEEEALPVPEEGFEDEDRDVGSFLRGTEAPPPNPRPHTPRRDDNDEDSDEPRDTWLTGGRD